MTRHRFRVAALTMLLALGATGCQAPASALFCGPGDGTFYFLEGLPVGSQWMIPGILAIHFNIVL